MDHPIQSPRQLSSHVRALRKARGLSQTQLGAVLGVGQTRIARIEHDPAAISVEQFLDLLGALGVQMVLRPMVSTRTADTEAPKETPGRSQVSLTPSGGLTRSGRSGGATKATAKAKASAAKGSKQHAPPGDEPW